MKISLQDEKGLSLVEVLASIVILTLLLTSFMLMFLISAKTNKVSEEFIDATYTAQRIMENIYSESKNETGRAAVLETYTEVGTDVEGWETYKINDEADGLIKLRFKSVEGSDNMERVIVEVYEMPQEILRSKMQNVLIWGAD